MTVTIASANQLKNLDACPGCGATHDLQAGHNRCEGCRGTRNAIQSQPGHQNSLLSKEMRDVDMLAYGGAAGSGKIWALLLDPLLASGSFCFGGRRRRSPTRGACETALSGL